MCWRAHPLRLLFAVVLILLASTTVFPSAAFASGVGPNLITNGDFSAGNAGFTTAYQYIADDPKNFADLWAPGTYTVDAGTLPYHPYWTRIGDHTTGSGKMLISNGHTAPGKAVWGQTVSGLTAGASYSLSAWAAGLCCATFTEPVAALNLWVIDVLAASWTLGAPGEWVGVTATWFAADTAARVEVRNSSTIYSGNDFALDDLTLQEQPTPTPEPASLLLLLSGGLVYRGLGRGLRSWKDRHSRTR